MSRTNFFPEANLKKGKVNVYSFRHGLPGYKAPAEIKRALRSSVAQSKSQDYFITEGSPFERVVEWEIYEGTLYPVSRRSGTAYCGLLTQTRTEHSFPGPPHPTILLLSQIPEIAQLKDLDSRTERAEFYIDGLFTDADKKILSALEAEETTMEQSNITFFTPEEVESHKRDNIAALDGQIEGVSKEELSLFFEKSLTGRSLLLARTSQYRAEALGTYPLGGHVGLFVGFLHSGEAVRFLKHPESVQRYLSRAPEAVKHAHEQNERMQQKITEAFHASVGQQRLSPTERTLRLKQTVDDEMVTYVKYNALPGTSVIRI